LYVFVFVLSFHINSSQGRCFESCGDSKKTFEASFFTEHPGG
jgi:hypothetical protein